MLSKLSLLFIILEASKINAIIPLVQKLNNHKFSNDNLKEGFSEMVTQNYECAFIYDSKKLVGVSGLWFCTRYYSSRSLVWEPVYKDEEYRIGLRNQVMEYIYEYAKRWN